MYSDPTVLYSPQASSAWEGLAVSVVSVSLSTVTDVIGGYSVAGSDSTQSLGLDLKGRLTRENTLPIFIVLALFVICSVLAAAFSLLADTVGRQVLMCCNWRACCARAQSDESWDLEDDDEGVCASWCPRVLYSGRAPRLQNSAFTGPYETALRHRQEYHLSPVERAWGFRFWRDAYGQMLKIRLWPSAGPSFGTRQLHIKGERMSTWEVIASTGGIASYSIAANPAYAPAVVAINAAQQLALADAVQAEEAAARAAAAAAAASAVTTGDDTTTPPEGSDAAAAGSGEGAHDRTVANAMQTADGHTSTSSGLRTASGSVVTAASIAARTATGGAVGGAVLASLARRSGARRMRDASLRSASAAERTLSRQLSRYTVSVGGSPACSGYNLTGSGDAGAAADAASLDAGPATRGAASAVAAGVVANPMQPNASAAVPVESWNGANTSRTDDRAAGAAGAASARGADSARGLHLGEDGYVSDEEVVGIDHDDNDEDGGQRDGVRRGAAAESHFAASAAGMASSAREHQARREQARHDRAAAVAGVGAAGGIAPAREAEPSSALSPANLSPAGVRHLAALTETAATLAHAAAAAEAFDGDPQDPDSAAHLLALGGEAAVMGGAAPGVDMHTGQTRYDEDEDGFREFDQEALAAAVFGVAALGDDARENPGAIARSVSGVSGAAVARAGGRRGTSLGGLARRGGAGPSATVVPSSPAATLPPSTQNTRTNPLHAPPTVAVRGGGGVSRNGEESADPTPNPFDGSSPYVSHGGGSLSRGSLATALGSGIDPVLAAAVALGTSARLMQQGSLLAGAGGRPSRPGSTGPRRTVTLRAAAASAAAAPMMGLAMMPGAAWSSHRDLRSVSSSVALRMHTAASAATAAAAPPAAGGRYPLPPAAAVAGASGEAAGVTVVDLRSLHQRASPAPASASRLRPTASAGALTPGGSPAQEARSGGGAASRGSWADAGLGASITSPLRLGAAGSRASPTAAAAALSAAGVSTRGQRSPTAHSAHHTQHSSGFGVPAAAAPSPSQGSPLGSSAGASSAVAVGGTPARQAAALRMYTSASTSQALASARSLRSRQGVSRVPSSRSRVAAVQAGGGRRAPRSAGDRDGKSCGEGEGEDDDVHENDAGARVRDDDGSDGEHDGRAAAAGHEEGHEADEADEMPGAPEDGPAFSSAGAASAVTDAYEAPYIVDADDDGETADAPAESQVVAVAAAAAHGYGSSYEHALSARRRSASGTSAATRGSLIQPVHIGSAATAGNAGVDPLSDAEFVHPSLALGGDVEPGTDAAAPAADSEAGTTVAASTRRQSLDLGSPSDIPGGVPRSSLSRTPDFSRHF